MIPAHGATLTVTNDALTATPTPLAASLTGSGENRIVRIADITGVTVTPGDAWTRSRVDVETGAGATAFWFAPGDVEGPEQLRSLLDGASSLPRPGALSRVWGAGH